MPRDPLDPRPSDRSLFNVLLSVERGLQAATDAVVAMGDKADGMDERLETMERGCAECRTEYRRCLEERRARQKLNGAFLSAVGAFFEYAPVKWLLAAAAVALASWFGQQAAIEAVAPLIPTAEVPDDPVP